MFIDVVFPKNNEEDFVKMAKKLGTKSLMFIYKDSAKLIKGRNKNLDIKSYFGLKTDKGMRIKGGLGIDVFISSSHERKDIENNTINIHYDLEEAIRRDKIHFRVSGLNHITANIISDKGKIIAISFSSLLHSKKLWRKAGRIKQNIILAKKFNIPVFMASFAEDPKHMRSKSNFISMGKILGLDDCQTKQSIDVLDSFFHN